MIKIVLFTLLTLMIVLNEATQSTGIPVYHGPPCNDTEDITTFFYPGLIDGYKIQVNRILNKRTNIILKFDMEASVTVIAVDVTTMRQGAQNTGDIGSLDGQTNMLAKNKTLTRKVDLGNSVFKLVLLKDTDKFEFQVQGQFRLLPPYLTSFKINGEENCKKPDYSFFHKYPSGAENRPDVANLFCGKRKALNQLIVNGAVSKPGHWPWHIALYRIERATLKYICGGTLVSNIIILTAAHCVTTNGIAVSPESLGISLGKHNLILGDSTSQEREVNEIIVHEEFDHKTLNNDIALLKMKTPIKFTSSIQPACIWFDKAQEKLTSDDIIGTVPGWGFDQTESLSTVLREATMPIIPDLDCIRSKPLFFSTILDGKKFCAGHRNGTSACNGDSGGGYFVYVPYNDSPFIKEHFKGAWYVRGIVSLSLAKQDSSFCDPNEYVVFTDITAYTDWLDEYMD